MTKDEALRLADLLDGDTPMHCGEAAAELRRLHDLLGKANALCRIRAAQNLPERLHPLQVKADRAGAWKIRDTKCGCDHNEYCEKCYPPAFRKGGYWDQQEALAQSERPWVGLTDREIDDLYCEHHDDYGYQLSATGYERAIEAKLKEKNT